MKTCLTGKEENIACRKNQLLCKNLVGKGFFFFFNDCFLGLVDFFAIVLECFEGTAKLVRILVCVGGEGGLEHQS